MAAVMFMVLWLALLTQPLVVERATIFPLEGNPTTALFGFERTVTPTARGDVVEVWFRDPQGQIAVYEKVTYENDAVHRYEFVQHQIGERYVLNVMGDQAVLEVEHEGRVTRSAHEWTDDTLTMDQIASYVNQHWDRLMSGEAVSFRLVALSRGRVVRFKITYREHRVHEGQPAVFLRMEAGNLFVRWFAPEIDLVFADDDDRSFLESRGLLPVKVLRGGEWEDLVGRLVWEH